MHGVASIDMEDVVIPFSCSMSAAGIGSGGTGETKTQGQSRETSSSSVSMISRNERASRMIVISAGGWEVLSRYLAWFLMRRINDAGSYLYNLSQPTDSICWKPYAARSCW